MTDQTALLAQLRGIVGEAHVLIGPDPAFETGVRGDHGRALCVLRPGSTAEVSASVAACVGANVRIIPQAGNTGLVGASTPDLSGGQVLLSVARLRAAPVVDRANRSVLVEAGVRLSDLNAALEPHGLCLPIDLGADPMIGGMIGTNTGGARFIRHGDVRRAVLGLEVVLPDAQGTVLNLLRPLRKNNTGLDTRQLFIGTGGAYGVVTRAMVEVQRLPRQTATALIVPRDDQALIDILLAFEEEAGDTLSAFEGMSEAAMTATFAHVPSLRNPFAGGTVPPFAVLVELARTHSPRDGEQMLDRVLEAVLTGLWSRDDAPVADAIIGRPEAIWALRHALSEGVRTAGALAAFDLSFARADLPAFRAEAIAMLAREFPRVRVHDFGHVGDGALHFNLVWPDGAPDGAERQAVRQAVYTLAVKGFGGSFSAEHGIGRANQDVYDHFTPDTEIRLANGIRTALGLADCGAVRLGPPSRLH